MPKNKHTLNENFVKPGEDFPYCGFPEPKGGKADWLTNMVPVPKKDGKVIMCVDFRDLNRACLKDGFPLPQIDVLVDNTVRSALMSFMDGFSRYNQILQDSTDL